MNLFLREMRAHRRSLIIWSIGMVVLVAGGMGKYGTLSGGGQSLNALISIMPKSVQVIMGLGDFDLTKASGFYGVLYLYLAVMAAIHAAMVGAEIISKEERDKTAEFLMTKPISRARVVTFKLLAGLANVIVLNLVAFAGSVLIVGALATGEAVVGDISVLMVGLLILQLIFLVVGTASASLSRKPRASASIAAAVLLITFIISVAIDLSDKLDFLRFFSPFEYFQAKDLMYGGGLDAAYVALSVAIIAVLVVTTYVLYEKRDLR